MVRLPIRMLSLAGLLTFALLRFASPVVADEHTKDSLEKIRVNLAQKKAVLVDVREPRETAQGYVREAIRLPLSRLQKQSDKPQFKSQLSKEIEPDKVVYTYCRSGRRSVVAGEMLRKLGYEVRPLKPGYQDLVDAGFESAE